MGRDRALIRARETPALPRYFDEGFTDMPCAVCGREFTPEREHRCEDCGLFACRDCLKAHYYFDQQAREIPTQTLCYHCYHERYGKPYDETPY